MNDRQKRFLVAAYKLAGNIGHFDFRDIPKHTDLDIMAAADIFDQLIALGKLRNRGMGTAYLTPDGREDARALMAEEPKAETSAAAPWTPQHTDYLINTQAIGSADRMPDGSVLSRDEYKRRGLTDERIRQLNNIMRQATPEEIAERKRVAGITSDDEAEWLAKVGKLVSNYNKALEQTNGSVSAIAALLESTMKDWKRLEDEYFEAGAIPVTCHANPVWIESVRRGFQMDRIREELTATEMFMRKLAEPVKRAIVRLPATGINPLPLSRFVDTMHERGNQPNTHLREAAYLVETARMKLEDAEQGPPHGPAGHTFVYQNIDNRNANVAGNIMTAGGDMTSAGRDAAVVKGEIRANEVKEKPPGLWAALLDWLGLTK